MHLQVFFINFFINVEMLLVIIVISIYEQLKMS